MVCVHVRSLTVIWWWNRIYFQGFFQLEVSIKYLWFIIYWIKSCFNNLFALQQITDCMYICFLRNLQAFFERDVSRYLSNISNIIFFKIWTKKKVFSSHKTQKYPRDKYLLLFIIIIIIIYIYMYLNILYCIIIWIKIYININ